MAIEAAWVDAFTEQPGRGNPAAVVLAPEGASPAWMQALAREFGLSETAFIRPVGTDTWTLRWFTPSIEVRLCGHATLASAWYLAEAGHAAPGRPIRFETLSGTLPARLDGADVIIDLPAHPVVRAVVPAGLASALGTAVTSAWSGGEDLVVLLATAGEVQALDPDMAALARLPVRGVSVTAPGMGDTDFVSRFFAPAVGVPEDPVTGSAHATLGPFWAERTGRNSLVAEQLSARGGRLQVQVLGARVLLRGRAVTVWRGTLGAALEAW